MSDGEIETGSANKGAEANPKAETRKGGCRAFEAEDFRSQWQADTLVGPQVNIGDRLERLYVISFIDDSSRAVLHSEIFFEENALRVLQVFKQALLKHGCP